MKRTFKSLAVLALSALAMVSCQKELLGPATQEGQEVAVSLDLTTPLMGTKAYADGKSVDVVHVHVYQHDANGNLTYIAPATQGAAIETPSKDVAMSAGAATYSTRLVTGQTYTFVFWAENSSCRAYSYDSANKTVTVDYTRAAGNDESRDAFYAVLKNVEITGAYSASVTLNRPFAQINFGASDYEAAKAAGITVTGASVKLTGIGNSINLLDGSVTGDETVTFAEAVLPTNPNATLTAANVVYKYVAMDYVLVGKGAKTLSDVTLTLAATGTLSATPEYTYSNVPLQGNYRTNIVGSLFTSPADINIKVEPGFGNPDENIVAQNVASIAAANGALSNGATAVTIANVTATEARTTKLQMPATSENITVTIEAIEPTANLQIEKPATGSNPASVSVTLPASASVSNLTINLPQSHVEVNGASYNTINATTSNNTLVIGSDVKVTTLTIEAGAVEIYGKVGTLTKGTNAGDVKVWAVGDEETWNKAYNAGAQTIELKNSFNVTNTIEIGRSLDIQGNGYEISHGTGSAQNSRVVNINGLNNQEYNFYNTIFSEKSTGDYSRGINVWGEASGSKITLDGCTVSAGYYALNFIVGPSDLEFTIKNGTVAAGWAAINCYANNSTFTVENSTLKGLNDKSESSWNDFSTIVFDGNGLWNAENIGVNGTGNRLNVVNSTIYASSESSNNQSWLALQYGAQRNIVKVDAATRIIDAAGNDQTYNIYLDPIVGYVSETEYTTYDLESEIWIGGSFVYPGYEASIGSTYYKTLAEAISATSGDVTVVLEPGDHILPTNLAGRSIILEGTDASTTVIDMSAGGTPQYGAKSVTFKNVTVKRNSGPFGGLSHCGEEHYVDSKVEGTLVTYAPVVTAVNTEFYQTSMDYYNIHIYASGSVTLDKCKFSCAGKSIYAHAETALEQDITITDCSFNASQVVSGKAAIQLHTELGIYGTLTVTNTTAEGFDSSLNGGLWNELNNSTKEVTNYFVKTIDGVQQN